MRELMLSEGRVERFLRRHGARSLQVAILVEQVTPALVRELRERLGQLWDEGAITFRSGSPLRIEHLRRVDFLHAATIIIPGADFAPTADPVRPGAGPGSALPAAAGPDPSESGAGPEVAGSLATDTRTIKTLLSITNAGRTEPGAPGEPAEGEDGTELPLVVAEIFDARKMSVARRAYGGKIEILASDAVISRLLAQNVRHRGLSHVYGELLSQGRGNAIYVRECPQFTEIALQTLTELFPHSVVLGVVRRHGKSYRPLLNPPDGFVVEDGDRLVLIARSYADSEPAPQLRPAPFPRGVCTAGNGAQRAPRRVLLLGWNNKVPALLSEFDSYANESFEIDILSAVPVARRMARLERYECHPKRLRVRHVEADYTVPSELAEVEPGGYDNVVFLGSDWLRSGEESDARTIVGYLLLRELLPEAEPRPDLLIELLDPSNLALFHRREGEVLISPSILSHILAQVALRRELRAVFDELFGSGGAELCFRRAAEFGAVGRELSFRDLQRLVALHGETALGVRTTAHGVRGGATLNPPRNQRWVLGPEDELVVLTAGG